MMREPISQNQEPAVLGWYGKLPSAGDFTGRGLPYEIVSQLDAWLQSGLVQLRHRHPDWQYFFSHSPIWSFLVPGGTLCGHSLVGCLMPSNDKVGRAYPLVALRSLRPDLPLQQELPPQGRWHGHVIETMLDARHESFSVEQFDAEYRRLAVELPVPPSMPAAGMRPAATAVPDVLQLFDAAPPPGTDEALAAIDPSRLFWAGALHRWPGRHERSSFWWTLGGGAAAQRVVHDGALTPQLLIDLLTRTADELPPPV